jgi:hypothetical protein
MGPAPVTLKSWWMMTLATSSRMASSGIHGDGLAERVADHLVLGQHALEEADQPLEAGGVALVALVLALRLHAAFAVVFDDADGLAGEVPELGQVRGEEHGAEIEDVPPAGLAGRDHLIVGEALQNAVAVLRERDFEQVEVRGVVEELEDVGGVDALHGDEHFEWRLIKGTPECTLTLGVVLEFFLVRADADVLDSLKLNGLVRCPRDLDHLNVLTVHIELNEAEVDAGAE